jgi:O-methyltransferase involved in polyketide biosynthesis
VPKVTVELSGVPETLLWTLYHRAEEARRPDAVLRDPLAVELVERIDYPFAERFGPAPGLVAQGQALRSLCFDRAVREFAATHPGGMVVALGEGLETAFQRVDDGRLRWLGVDLPETVAVRAALLGDEGARHRSLALSALDPAWMDEVDPGRGVLITAQGLLMYLHERDVHALIGGAARRFPGQAMVFDTAPRVFTALASRGALKTPGGFTAPPMPWGMDAGGRAALARAIPGVAAIEELPLPRGRGAVWTRLAPLLVHLPVIGGWRLTVCRARFQPSSDARSRSKPG